VNTKVRFSPLFNPPAGAKLYVAILEKKTTANVKTNGETEFLQVMKKMLPTETGSAVPTVAIGSWDSITQNYTFKGNYRLPADGQAANRINHATEHSIEEFGDLMVIAWIQAADKTVYQALNLTPFTPTGTEDFTASISQVEVYPNPASDVLNITVNAKATDKLTAMLLDMNGNVVWSKYADITAGKNSLELNTSKLAAGTYNAVIIDSKNNSSVHKIVITH
jgi:hypothetical protein